MTSEKFIEVSDFLEDESIPAITKGIGGSDIGAIMGYHDKRSAWDVWATMTGKAERFHGNDATDAGTAFEPFVADTYSRRKGVQLVGPTSPVIDGFMRRSPDRFILQEKALLEVKTSLGFGAGKMWGAEPDGPAAIPNYVVAQVQWYMAKPYQLNELVAQHGQHSIETYALLNGNEFTPEYTDVAAFVTKPQHKYYRVYHDPESAAELMQVAEDFWRKHIVRGIEPDADHSEAAAKHLAKRFEQTTEEMKAPSSDTMPMIKALQDKHPKLLKLEKEVKGLKAAICKAIGEDRGFKGDFGSLTWYTQSRNNFNKDLLYQNLMAHLPREVIDRLFASSKKPSETRILRATWKKNK